MLWCLHFICLEFRVGCSEFSSHISRVIIVSLSRTV
uniref:Uncharacterized protein n=1 Tax=Rhizophora mucronata TaxID=61149 RepID=A0A2P2PI52_RHIMU